MTIPNEIMYPLLVAGLLAVASWMYRVERVISRIARAHDPADKTSMAYAMLSPENKKSVLSRVDKHSSVVKEHDHQIRDFSHRLRRLETSEILGEMATMDPTEIEGVGSILRAAKTVAERTQRRKLRDQSAQNRPDSNGDD